MTEAKIEELGTKNVAIDKLHLDATFKHRVKSEHVKELAASIERTILIHKPRVRKVGSEYVPIAGRDRIAAHMLLGRKHVPVEVVECSDGQAFEMERIENIHRRRDPQEARKAEQELLDYYTKEAEAKDAEPEPEAEARPKKGPKKSARSKAREKVAAAKGVKPESVKRAEMRARQREAAAQAQEKKAPEKPEAGLKLLGITAQGPWLEQVSELRTVLIRAQLAIKPICAELQKHAQRYKGKEGLAVDRVLRFHEQLHDLAKAIRGAVPAGLCPYCKGLDGVAQKCGQCNDTCFITTDAEKQVPPELLETGDNAIVYYMGKSYLVNENVEAFKSGKPTPIPGGKAKKPLTLKTSKKNPFAVLGE